MATVAAAVASGDRRQLLEAMQERVAGAIDSDRTLARDLAALTRRALEIAKELEALDAEGSDDDDSEDEDGEFDPTAI